MRPLIYLASPYSHRLSAVRELRFRAVEHAAAAMMAKGHAVFSPIVHCHKLAVRHVQPTDAQHWWEYNQVFLTKADELVVLELPGWEASHGVKMEIDFMQGRSRPVIYLSPSDFGMPDVLETLAKLA